MNPARLFRPLHFNDQLFKNASSNGYMLANQPQLQQQPIGLSHPALPEHQSNAVPQQPPSDSARWSVGQRAANSDFGALQETPVAVKTGSA